MRKHSCRGISIATSFWIPKAFPKEKFKGTITNLSDVNFSTDGTCDAAVVGNLTIHGVTKAISNNGTITVSNGAVQVDTKFNVTLADHEIAFEKGKPSTNVSKEVEVIVKSVFSK